MSSSISNNKASSNPEQVPSTPQRGASYSWFGAGEYGVYTHRCEGGPTCTSPGAHRTPIRDTGLSPFRPAETPVMDREKLDANLAAFVAERQQRLARRQPKRRRDDDPDLSFMGSLFVEAVISGPPPPPGSFYSPAAFTTSPSKRRRLLTPSSTGSPPPLEAAFVEQVAGPEGSVAELEAPQEQVIESDPEVEEVDELDSSTDGEAAGTHPAINTTVDIHPQPSAQDGGAAVHDEDTLPFPADRAELVKHFAKGLSLRNLFEKETRADGSILCKAPLVLISGQWYRLRTCAKSCSTGEIYQRHIKSGHLNAKERSSMKKILEDWGETGVMPGKSDMGLMVAAWDRVTQPFPDVPLGARMTKGKATSRAGTTKGKPTSQ